MNFCGYCGFVAFALLSIAIGIKIPPSKIIERVLHLSFPPLPLSLASEITQAANMRNQDQKVKKIHANYSCHHEKIKKLAPSMQKKIWTCMYEKKLSPPSQVIQDAPSILADFNPWNSLFTRFTDEVYEKNKREVEWLNRGLAKINVPSLPSLQEQREESIKKSVESLQFNEIQWIILSASSLKSEVKVRLEDLAAFKARAEKVMTDDTSSDSTKIANSAWIREKIAEMEALVPSP